MLFRSAELEKRRAKLEQDAEFHKGKPLPAELRRASFEVESDLRAQHTLLEAKQSEVETIKARYDEDRRRYLKITGASTTSSAPAASKAP